MAQKQEAASNQEIAETPENGKALVNRDGSVTKLIEWATESSATPEQILDQFLEADIPVSHGEEITGDYVVVHGDEKARWCSAHVGQRLIVVVWNFWEGQGDSEFASMHIVSGAGKFIVNDSSKGGMYGQIRQITDKRERDNPEAASKRTSTAGLMVAGGLRANKTFLYNKNTGSSIPRAELDDFIKHPANAREESRPTWSFDL